MPLSEGEKIKLAKSAFQKFFEKIKELCGEQKFLFEKILKRIEERKIAKIKEEINKLKE